jgi:hypothetical protein
MALRILTTLCLAVTLGACASGTRSYFNIQDREGARPMGLASTRDHPIRVYLDAADRAARSNIGVKVNYRDVPAQPGPTSGSRSPSLRG